MKTDWRKYRKSTHLASADLDAMETDGLPLIFTIKNVKYEIGVDVSGTKQDGIFCYFIEAVKPLKLNSTNNKILAGFAKQDGLTGKECHYNIATRPERCNFIIFVHRLIFYRFLLRNFVITLECLLYYLLMLFYVLQRQEIPLVRIV